MDAMKDSQNWLEYVQLVRERDDCRRAAEKADRERRLQWVAYYKAEKRIKELDILLGVNDVCGDDVEIEEETKIPEKTCPGAPRKRSRLSNL